MGISNFRSITRHIQAIAIAASFMAVVAKAQSCTDFSPTDFKKTTLTSGLESPMKMAIAKDGRIFFVQRTGNVMLLKPGTTTSIKIGNLAVANNDNNEDGVLGIALDPKFESNSYIFIYHTLQTPIGYYVDRYTLVGDALTAEKRILSIPHVYPSYDSKPQIIHAAGAIEFDPAGNLLIATGDIKITMGGFAVPVNENNFNFDAQGTSANSNSLLGKILRITPKEEGGYSIPSGNLFVTGTANTKPEIYAMGVRNPFTLTVDPQTGWAYSGEVGPDGTGTPINSQDEVNQIKVAANLGWPYLTGDNQAYNDMNGTKYDAANLVNNSKNNTGIKTLPAPTKSLFWFSNVTSWPITGVKPAGGSRCIKIGAFYRYNAAIANAKKLPPAMDNGFFMANHEENDAMVRFFKLGADGSLVSIKNFMTGFFRPMDFKIGPDGAFYAIDWGTDNGHWFNGTTAGVKDGKITKVEYTGSCSTGLNGLKENRISKSDKVLYMATVGSKIQFPVWANSVEGFDLSGKRVFKVKKSEATSALEQSGIFHLVFSE